MSGVDDRIVSMKFDNASFEHKLSATIGSLDKLRQSLGLTGSTKGFEHITAAANAVNLGTIATGVEGIASKFNAMSVMAVAALTRVTHMAVDAGLRFAKSFTVAPIMDGFREMETKMGSIQTILANTSAKGTTLTQVTDSLDELNRYADKTIYNFGEMTKNIGLFTNAGIGIEDATAMIKGFSNSAAASGTNAQAAAGAAYQLSQALSAGTIRLMDWRSLTNAGMGNKNMQNGIIEIAAAMGELNKAGISSEEIQGNFNASLEKNWLSADVMTKYLKIMAGEMTEAEMAQMGLTQAQVDNFKKQQKIAEDAATKVRTFSQLVSTAKEAVGSGWSQTFELILGNFDQATELFTNINNAVGGFIGRVSDARNELFRGWAAFGGRDTAIEGLKNAFGALGDIMSAVGKAFRSVFPKTTSYELIQMTNSFANFTENLRELVNKWLPAITVAFTAVFTVVKVVWEVIKGVVGVFFDLIGAIGSLVGGDGEGFFRNLGASVSKLNKIVESGAIANFFAKIGEYIKDAAGYIQDFKDKVVGLFDGFSGAEAVEETTGKVTEKMGLLAGAAEFVREAFGRVIDRFTGIGSALSGVFETIAGFIGGLGQKLADLIKPGDFNSAVDAVNVGLLGGILLVLRKFLRNGLKIDLSGGLFDSIKGSFDTLTGTLKNMQAQIKAKALLKIAGAIAIITGSLVVLSMIDSEKLTKALLAMSVGFGQLVATMALMDKISVSPMKMNGLATAMILMSTAMGILSMAVTNFSQLSTEALIKGLGGVAAAMVIMTTAMNMMSAGTPGMLKASIAMGAVGVALLVISKVVSVFSDMELKEMAQGLLGVAASMLIIAVGMKAINTKATLGSGLAMLALAFSLKNMADAVQAFANIPWPEIAQGTASITILLLAISSALRSMPNNIAASAAGLVLVSGALLIMAHAVETMGSIKMGELVKGLGALVILLTTLSVALNVMNGTAAGAAALLVASGALVVLSGVLQILGGMSLSEIGLALVAMAGSFVVLGAAGLVLGPLAPALMAVGTAMALVGGAFALFGGGAYLAAKAFAAMGKSGVVGAKAFVAAAEVVVAGLPRIVGAFITSLGKMRADILSLIPMMIEAFASIITRILDVIIKLAPKIGETLVTVISAGLSFLGTIIPKVIETGITILLALLRGIRDNIGEIVDVAADIVTNFMDALAEKIPSIVESAFNLLYTVLTEVAAKLGEVLPTLFFDVAGSLIGGLLKGLEDTFPGVLTWFRELPGKILTIIKDLFGIKSPSTKFLDIGKDLVAGLLKGLVDTVGTVMTWFTSLPGKIIGWVGDVTRTLWEKGTNFVSGLVGGLGSVIGTISTWFTSLPGKILGFLGDVTRKLWDKGKDFISGLYAGVTDRYEDVRSWFSNLGGKIFNSVGNLLGTLRDVGKDIMNGLWDGLKDVWDDVKGWLSNLNPANWFNDINPYKGHAVKNLVSTGGAVMQGLWNGMKDGWGKTTVWLKKVDPSDAIDEKTLGDKLVAMFERIFSRIREVLDRIEAGVSDMSPTITPVADMTAVERAFAEAALDPRVIAHNRQMASRDIAGNLSRAQAGVISTTAEVSNRNRNLDKIETARDMSFTQNIYSPQPLSVNDVYRNTKSQIAMAKEELKIA
jgi:tape measure domain-containing protein